MWIKKTNLTVYVSHFLSCWGTHMWIFGMGMFLVRIADDDLQLSATYGLATGLAIFLFGPLVGHWVDSTPRLKAAQLSLVLQDAVRLACAALIAVYLWYQSSITNIWLFPLLQASIVALGVLSNLASQARMLAVERDWIIEICGRDSDLLATMTAAMRRIDQVGMILSPIATGQVIFYSGLMYGAIFIGAWNASSVFVEFYLTWKVYNVVPALNQKKDSCRNNVELPIILDSKDKLENDSGSLVTPLDLDLEVEGHKEKRTKMVNSQMNTCGRVLFQFVTLYRGWRTYMRYSVALAGLALACLYMTVLGFDSITVAYAANQGLSESVLGILMGSSAVFGIIGTFAYPIIRHRVGLVRTGLIALSCEVSCLTLCVASIWMPGSPFDPTYRKAGHTSVCNKVNTSVSLACTEVLAMASENSTSLFASTSAVMNATSCNTSAMHCIDSYISVIFLMAGIFLARFGLWVADLTITQLFLQQVEETERGLVNGVQSSLNQLMDLLKFALVVALPDMETFGFLILLSFVFIAAGWSLYAIFVRRESRSNSRGVSC